MTDYQLPSDEIKTRIMSEIFNNVTIGPILERVIEQALKPVMQSYCQHDYIKNNDLFREELCCTYCGHKKGSIP